MKKLSSLQYSDALPLYQTMVDRVKHEGATFWTRFSAFFVIVAAMGAAWTRGAVEPTREGTGASFLADPFIHQIVLIAGAATSTAWLLANWNGAVWQEYFSRVLEKLEQRCPALGDAYTGHWSASWSKVDVMGIAMILSLSATVAWVAAAFRAGERTGWIAIGACVVIGLGAWGATLLVEKLAKTSDGDAADETG